VTIPWRIFIQQRREEYNVNDVKKRIDAMVSDIKQERDELQVKL